jgi:hypothetical protein
VLSIELTATAVSRFREAAFFVASKGCWVRVRLAVPALSLVSAGERVTLDIEKDLRRPCVGRAEHASKMAKGKKWSSTLQSKN